MQYVPSGSEDHPNGNGTTWDSGLPVAQTQQLFLFNVWTVYFIHSIQAFVSLYPISIATVYLRSLTSTTVTWVQLLHKHGGNVGVEVELGVIWERLEARQSSKAPKGSVPDTSSPNPYLRNMHGSRVILQGLSKTNLSGLHCLSLQVGEGCV
jgi:hypothetical protein